MRYAKFVAAVVATIVSAIGAGLANGEMSDPEWVNVAIAAVGAVTVLGAANLPVGVWRYTKAVMAALAGVLVVLNSAIVGGVTDAEWAQIVIAGFGAVGVLAVPNTLARHRTAG